ncbi:MAG: CrcB family protein [Gammaproteobacteria bacterium]
MNRSLPPGRHRAPLVLLLVFLGGTLGSLARELLAPALPAPWFWFPILSVNLLACFFLGILFALRGQLSPNAMHFAAGGFCGGFSTFSHFSYEIVVLADAGAALEAGAYVALAVGLGIGAALLGEVLGYRLRGETGP